MTPIEPGSAVIVDGTLYGIVLQCFEDSMLVALSEGNSVVVHVERLELS